MVYDLTASDSGALLRLVRTGSSQEPGRANQDLSCLIDLGLVNHDGPTERGREVAMILGI